MLFVGIRSSKPQTGRTCTPPAGVSGPKNGRSRSSSHCGAEFHQRISSAPCSANAGGSEAEWTGRNTLCLRIGMCWNSLHVLKTVNPTANPEKPATNCHLSKCAISNAFWQHKHIYQALESSARLRGFLALSFAGRHRLSGPGSSWAPALTCSRSFCRARRGGSPPDSPNKPGTLSGLTKKHFSTEPLEVSIYSPTLLQIPGISE